MSNVFMFAASGTISNCCTQRGPDGLLAASNATVVGVNGLSNVVGNSGLPPPAATRLYLGIADGFDGQPPTMHGDNSGSFAVHVTRQ